MRRDERCIYRIWRNNFSRKYQTFETMAMACCGRERRFTAGLSLVLSISSRIITSWFLLISTITVDEIRSSYVIMETIRRGLRITPSVVKRLRYERKYVKRSVVLELFFFNRTDINWRNKKRINSGKEVFLKKFGNTFGSRKVEVYLRRMIEMLLRTPIVLYPRRQRLFLLRRVIYCRRNGDGSSSIELCKNKFLFHPPLLPPFFFF